MKKTLVLGASTNPDRYSYLAANRLANAGHEIVLLGNRPGEVNGTPIQTEQKPFDNIHTVTMYLSARNQANYYDYLLEVIKPERVIFNPGAENPELESLLQKQGIDTLHACTLVMLSANSYE